MQLQQLPKHLIQLIAIAAIITIGSEAKAILLPVSNHSFEEDVLSVGSFSLTTPTDWDTDDGSIGYLNGGSPGDGVFPTPDGTTQVAILNEARRGSGGIYQTLSNTIEANTLYTLTVDVGDGLSTNFPSIAEIRLGAGSQWDQNVLPVFTSSTPTPLNGWETWEMTYRSNQFSQHIGESIRIELVTNAVQGLFDNVRLDASPIPESSTVFYAFLIIGFVVAYRIRKNRS